MTICTANAVVNHPRARTWKAKQRTRAHDMNASYLNDDTYRSMTKDGTCVFLHCMVRAKDLEHTMKFWRAIGLVETRRKESTQGRYTLVFMAPTRGAAEIEITWNWPDAATGESEVFAPPSRSFGHVAYAVDDVYVASQRVLDEGFTLARPPKDGRMAFAVSPDGVSVELLQKGEALEPREPWTTMANVGTW